MSYSSKFLGSEIQQSITFADASNLTTDYIITTIENICNSRNIPVSFRKDTVVSGKMFSKKTYDCVVVSHPSPPQDYAS